MTNVSTIKLSFAIFSPVISLSSFFFIGILLKLFICSIILRLWHSTFIYSRESISNLFSSILCFRYVLIFLFIFLCLAKFIANSCLSFTSLHLPEPKRLLLMKPIRNPWKILKRNMHFITLIALSSITLGAQPLL